MLDILQRILKSSTPPPSEVLVTFATHLITNNNTPLIVGRSALTALVLALGAGLSIDLRLLKPSLFSSDPSKAKITPENALDADEQRFYEIGKEAWVAKDEAAFEARKTVVKGIIDAVGTSRNDAGSDGGRGWCDEQVTWPSLVLSMRADLDWYVGDLVETRSLVYLGAGGGLVGSCKNLDGHSNGNDHQVRLV